MALWDLLLKGDLDEAAVAERPWYREVLDEADPHRQLRLNARNSRVVKERIAGVLETIRNAAPVDADIDALWNLIQTDFYDNQRSIVGSLHRKKALRPGLDVTRATDILWTLNHPDMWQLLVGRRAWTPEQYEKWFADTACSQLLKPLRTKQADQPDPGLTGHPVSSHRVNLVASRHFVAVTRMSVSGSGYDTAVTIELEDPHEHRNPQRHRNCHCRRREVERGPSGGDGRLGGIERRGHRSRGRQRGRR